MGCGSAACGVGGGVATAAVAGDRAAAVAVAVANGGRRDGLGVHELAAQHVGLPDVRDQGEHGASARHAVLPGAGGPRGLQPDLPLRAPLRRRRLVRHRRRLRPRARAPRDLPRRHPARLHLHR